jgi:hypothetical protein
MHLLAYDVDFLAPCNAHVTDVYDQDSGEALGYATTIVVAKRGKEIDGNQVDGLKNEFRTLSNAVVSKCNNGTLKQGLQNPRTFIARFGFYF